MAGVRKIVRGLWREHNLGEWPREQRLDLALTLLARPHAEDKLAGILLLGEHMLPELASELVPALALPFERGDIDDWSTCDWYCVKVLARLVEQKGREAAEAVAAWRRADRLWQRRAAAVSLVRIAPRADELPWLPELIFDVCAANAHDPARFSQTSLGWVLRELSKADPARVARFVEEHRDVLSREARYMATYWLDEEIRRRFNPLGARR